MEFFIGAGGRVVVQPLPIEIGVCAVVADPWEDERASVDRSKGRLNGAEATEA